jgi:hypothetical protein
LLSWQYGLSTNLPWGISIANPEFKYHPINVYTIIVTAPVFVWLWKHRGEIGSGRPFAEFITFLGIGLLLVSFFKPHTGVVLGMSQEQFLYFILVIMGNFISFELSSK